MKRSTGYILAGIAGSIHSFIVLILFGGTMGAVLAMDDDLPEPVVQEARIDALTEQQIEEEVERRLEAERIAAEEALLEEQRRIAEEQRLEEERLAEEQRLEEERLAQEEQARVEAEAAAAAQAEAERQAAQAARASSTTSSGSSGRTYVNSAGNTVQSPVAAPSAPAGATAQCKDGTYSFSQSRRGTCSGHGGVAKWL